MFGHLASGSNLTELINDKCCCHIMACHKFAFVSITHLSILCVRSLAFSSLTHTLRFSRPVNGGEASTTKSATQAIVTSGVEWTVKRKVPWLKGGRESVNINDKSEYRHLKNVETIKDTNLAHISAILTHMLSKTPLE
ncbi:hypothetical protein GQX74_014413 [Glossina fuscipes]|nr:hypothetical protein GQX74_014413 [Glossina fuscipes]